MFAQDNLFDSNELLAMRVLPSISMPLTNRPWIHFKNIFSTV